MSDGRVGSARCCAPTARASALIGADGTCKVCGRVMPELGRRAQARPRSRRSRRGRRCGRGARATTTIDDEDDDDATTRTTTRTRDEDEATPSAARRGEWTERKLCPDGACVGVIGDDGMCTVCGKRSAA